MLRLFDGDAKPTAIDSDAPVTVGIKGGKILLCKKLETGGR